MVQQARISKRTWLLSGFLLAVAVITGLYLANESVNELPTLKALAESYRLAGKEKEVYAYKLAETIQQQRRSRSLITALLGRPEFADDETLYFSAGENSVLVISFDRRAEVVSAEVAPRLRMDEEIPPERVKEDFPGPSIELPVPGRKD